MDRKNRTKPVVSVVIPTHDRKEKLVRLVQSVLASDYPARDLEIIIVDDNSKDGTFETVRTLFPDATILRNQKTSLVSASRNRGIERSQGEFIFLIDDDNILHPSCIRSMVESARNDPGLGAIMPLMFYHLIPEKIWCAGIGRGKLTSITRFRTDITDPGKEAERLIPSEDCPNSFMIRRDVYERIGLFDEIDFPIMYEEADYGARIRKCGYHIACDTQAKIWHDMDFTQGNRLIFSESRAYYTSRNRLLYHKKHTRPWQFAVFLVVFFPLISAHYLMTGLFHSGWSVQKKTAFCRHYFKGIKDGFSRIIGFEIYPPSSSGP